jgi:hypothetical protein
MRFDNEIMSLWFGTPDALGPSDTVPAGAEIAITIAVQPGDRSNKVEVIYRVNKGSDERVRATWLRNDAPANVQYFRAHLPPRLAGDTVEYIPVAHLSVSRKRSSRRQVRRRQAALGPLRRVSSVPLRPVAQQCSREMVPGLTTQDRPQRPLAPTRNPAAGPFPAWLLPALKVMRNRRQPTRAMRPRKMLPLFPITKSESTRLMRFWQQRKVSKR